MAQEMIWQKDKQEARTQRDQEARILDKIRRQEAAVLKREGVIARSCEQARKHVLEGLEPGDYGAGAFYILVPDRETEAKMAALVPMRLRSSSPIIIPSSPPVLIRTIYSSWLDKDIVPLDQEDSIIAASDMESLLEDKVDL